MKIRPGDHLSAFLLCIMALPLLLCDCSYVNGRQQVTSRFHEANDLFSQGNYQDALGTYHQILEKYPAARDRVLFEMGIIYAHPANIQKEYQKSLACFQDVIKDFPDSSYRKDSQIMAFNINTTISKDETIAAQRTHIETLQNTLISHRNESAALLIKSAALEQALTSKENEISALKREVFTLQKGPVDKILVEKQARRLTLILQGTPLKSYRIALGGNPDGPKEKQGDNKTPEGSYVIDALNKSSHYHLSLHISYPNENDRKRAKKMGVAPGGNIMIHGSKNGLSWAGDMHTQVDWTKGCIAVTDREIEEIARLAPPGTVVEIRP